jgi:hypothetical protein
LLIPSPEHTSLISRAAGGLLKAQIPTKAAYEGRILKAVAPLFETDRPAAAIREAQVFAAEFHKANHQRTLDFLKRPW